MSRIEIEVATEKLILLPEKAIYWPAQKTLILADLHLSKAGHFRKHGIAVPTEIMVDELNRLEKLIADWLPSRLLIIGDMFHSQYNQEVRQFSEWRHGFDGLEIALIKGNHDLFKREDYHDLKLSIIPGSLASGPFLFTHKPPAESQSSPELYTLAGHVHPGVELKGKGRQYLRLPCYYFGKHFGLLPAFGRFTGLMKIEGEKDDRVFAITGQEVVSLN